jgi:hypothetical protein
MPENRCICPYHNVSDANVRKRAQDHRGPGRAERRSRSAPPRTPTHPLFVSCARSVFSKAAYLVMPLQATTPSAPPGATLFAAR